MDETLIDRVEELREELYAEESMRRSVMKSINIRAYRFNLAK